jgi:hypothetical protein
MQAAGTQERAFDPYLATDVDVLALLRDTAEDAQVLHQNGAIWAARRPMGG